MPLKGWIKSALDQAIQVCMGEPDLEFVWVGDDAIDPLQQAQTLNILVTAGIKTRDEARAELGLGGEGKPPGAPSASSIRITTERARFTTSENVGPTASTPQYPEGWQACHEKCLAETEGVWPPSDRPAEYRRCVRACLGAGADY